MTATYDLEQVVKLTFTVKVDGTLTDATVVLTLTDPDGAATTPTVTNASTGVYTATVTPTVAGMWLYRWEATGAATTAEDGQFIVEANAAADIYATVAELKARWGDTLTTDDEMYEKAIRAASRGIDKACGRRFYKDTAATARVYYPCDGYRVEVDDLHTATGLVVKTDQGDDGTYETTWAAADYQLEPLNGVVDGESGWPWYRIRAVEGRKFPTSSRRAPVEVTAKWGWAAVPVDIREACLIASAELVKLKDAPFGVAGFSEFGAVRIRDNPKVAMLIAPYSRYPLLVA